jgi:uncharacterized protein (DUF58 family)
MKIRRIILLLAFILALAAISNYGGVISYTLFYAVLLIPLLLLAYLIAVYASFAVHQEIETRNIVAGNPVPYRVILRNEGRLVFTSVAMRFHSDYSYTTDKPERETFTLFPGEGAAFDTKLFCKYRGEYEVGVEKLVITDFFGIFRFSYRLPTTIAAIVKPRIVHLDVLRDVPELEVFLQSYVRQDINEPDLTVRAYIPGDPLKKIHWKATAKSGELKVRDEVGTLKQKVLVLADFQRISKEMPIFLPLENQILEQTIALLYYFVRQHIPAELVFAGETPQSRQVGAIAQFNQLYEELAAIRFRADNSFAALFAQTQASGLFAQETVIFLVVQALDIELFSALTQLAATGKMVTAYVVGDNDISEYVRQSSARLKVVGVEV